jgi:hypothetical protein
MDSKQENGFDGLKIFQVKAARLEIVKSVMWNGG